LQQAGADGAATGYTGREPVKTCRNIGSKHPLCSASFSLPKFRQKAKYFLLKEIENEVTLEGCNRQK
jgi:hypothetical protein